MKRLVVHHPVIAYFALTFALSWGGVLLVIGAEVHPTAVQAQNRSLFAWTVVAMLAGPITSAVALTALLGGRAELAKLGSAVLDWRSSFQGHALALLAAPLAAGAASLTLSLVSSNFLPAFLVAGDIDRLIAVALIVGLAAGVAEELGWTGFAIPRLLRSYGPVRTGLTVGLLWSAWHVLVVVWGIGNRTGNLPLSLFVTLDGLAVLPAFRVLMVRVYTRTRSVPLAMAMHASLTMTTLVVTPRASGVDLLAYDMAFAAILWALSVAAGVAGRVPSPSTEPVEPERATS